MRYFIGEVDNKETPLLSADNKNNNSTTGIDRNSISFQLASLISLQSNSSDLNVEHNVYRELAKRIEEINEEKLQNPTAIYQSSTLPYCSKVFIPVLIILNIALFITANLNVGASVLLTFEVFGLDFSPSSLFNFSLVNSIEDMYEAKAYVLSGLVFLWSGTWPYVKLLVLLFCWFISPDTLSIRKRGMILELMDFFGKWCMIDAFLMVILSVAFHFDIVLAHDNLFKLNVTVTNEIGLYIFIMATILTLILSHIMLVYHKNALNVQFTEEMILNHLKTDPKQFVCPCPTGSWFNVGSLEHNRAADSRMSLLRYSGGVRPLFRNAKLKAKILILLFNLTLFSALIGGLGFLIHGAYQDLFSYKYAGLVGDLISVVAPSLQTQTHSLISIGNALTTDINSDLSLDRSKLFHLTPGGYFGMLWIQSIYFFFCFYFPAILVVFLFVLWFVPMTLRNQKIVLYCIEIIASWSSIEVYILSLVATNFEISQFARFLLKEPCTEIEEVFKTTCFAVDCEFHSGLYYLLASMVLIVGSTQLILHYSTKAIDFREDLALIEVKEKYTM